MEDSSLPSFALVVATVDRSDALRNLLDSLERQTHRNFRVVIVDQNDDDRLLTVLADRQGLDIAHLRSARGLSRARNTALPVLRADIVAFPDDDCAYPDDLLEQVARLLGARPELDGVTGRTADAAGRSSDRWGTQPALIERNMIWHAGNSASTFLRRSLVERVGQFDERLGLGPDSTWSSGEEIDYLVRALDLGARIEYDPSLVVLHELRSLDPEELRVVGRRDGGSVGYILRKHRFALRVIARMLARSIGGIAISLARGDLARARFHAATLCGRLDGLRG